MIERNRLQLDRLAALDGLLVTGLLSLTFLFGCFRQIDADIWWHLKAGQSILQRGEIPRTDWFTFGASDRAWIDLHWLFQLAVAWLHARGDMPLLVLTSATLGTVAVGILLAARRAGWPVAVSVACWLPVVFLLAGRFYVRPEILTLVFLAVFLTVLFHAEKHPRLAWLLVPVQLVWVNVQGLFVFGPVLLGFWWAERVVRWLLGRAERIPWHVAAATAGVAAACLGNPYCWRGALFPLELFRKMSADHDFYGQHIGELQSIRAFIAENGLHNPYLVVHLALLIAGAASFLLPLSRWRVSWFRVFAFAAFGWLSLQATRNSGQFALVAGSVLAWNVGEWWADRKRTTPSLWRALPGRAVLAAALSASLWLVASGRFYAFVGEGRLVGLGEQPLWHAHEAAEFAARPRMPAHVLAYHEGQAAVFEFHMRPDQRVYCDPRLEVMPRELMEDYYELGQAIARDRANWRVRIQRLPRPLTILVDHRARAGLEATLLADPNWRCVFFDPVAGVFVARQTAEPLRLHEVDFAARHFSPNRQVANWPMLDPDRRPSAVRVPRAEFVEAQALFNIARSVHERQPAGSRLATSLLMLGVDRAQAGVVQQPESFEGWRLLGLCHFLLAAQAVGPGDPPLDAAEKWAPVVAGDIVRARYCLERARQLEPHDFVTFSYLYSVASLQNDHRLLFDAGCDLLSGPRTARERETLKQLQITPESLKRLQVDCEHCKRSDGVRTAVELQDLVAKCLNDGCVVGAIRLFQRFTESEGKLPWELADRYAGLLVRVAAPGAAREVWQSELAGQWDEGTRLARIATTHLIEGDYIGAIANYRTALRLTDDCAEARWGLARTFLEIGDAVEVVRVCDAALDDPALSPAARSRLEWMRELALPFATPAMDERTEHGAN